MAFRQYFNSPTYSDVILCYGGVELPAHKLVLSTGSDYFQAMLNSKYEEATKSKITIHGDNANALSGVICTFYGHTAYDMQTISSTDKGVQQVLYVVDLYVTASKYLVPSLCSKIVEDFTTMLNAVQGEAGYSANIESVAFHVYSVHVGAAEELRGPIVGVIVANIEAWRASTYFAQLVAELPELAMDVIGLLAGAKQQPAVKKSKRAAAVADTGDIVVAPRKSQRLR
ncbi:hypothetical protein LTR17_023947 [Elasticomyces elasticus]|nr:hypothetical protein LTR17_023947 [Elasticomyces elasticus]